MCLGLADLHRGFEDRFGPARRDDDDAVSVAEPVARGNARCPVQPNSYDPATHKESMRGFLRTATISAEM